MSREYHKSIFMRFAVDWGIFVVQGIIFILISLYQKTISPDHGIFFSTRGGFAFGGYALRRCRFHPSCSEYSKEAFGQYGLLRGSMSSLARIIRCGPWSAGGYDPVGKITNS